MTFVGVYATQRTVPTSGEQDLLSRASVTFYLHQKIAASATLPYCNFDNFLINCAALFSINKTKQCARQWVLCAPLVLWFCKCIHGDVMTLRRVPLLCPGSSCDYV